MENKNHAQLFLERTEAQTFRQQNEKNINNDLNAFLVQADNFKKEIKRTQKLILQAKEKDVALEFVYERFVETMSNYCSDNQKNLNDIQRVFRNFIKNKEAEKSLDNLIEAE